MHYELVSLEPKTIAASTTTVASRSKIVPSGATAYTLPTLVTDPFFYLTLSYYGKVGNIFQNYLVLKTR
jgi:hypothetical protein